VGVCDDGAGARGGGDEGACGAGGGACGNVERAAPPQMMLMRPGQSGMSAGWQRGSKNNQPPNAEMNSSEVVAGSEGSSGMALLDPVIGLQWQELRLMHMSQQVKRFSRISSVVALYSEYTRALTCENLQQMMHMHCMIEMLQMQNTTLHAEKSNSLMVAHPHKGMRVLEQEKGKLEKDVMELLQQKTNLQCMCMQLHRFMGTLPTKQIVVALL
jgi:hypothetical protein